MTTPNRKNTDLSGSSDPANKSGKDGFLNRDDETKFEEQKFRVDPVGWLFKRFTKPKGESKP